MINLLSIFPDINDGTCFYRGMGPLIHLRQNFKLNGETININLMPNEDPWHVYRSSDAVFLQRPFSQSHLIAIEQSKKCGRRVWIDYDDDYFDIRPDNPAWDFYRQPGQKDLMRKIASSADVITTSTKHLSNVYGEYNDNVITIPNAIDEVMFSWRDPSPVRAKKILWRGSPIHAEALSYYGDRIASVAHDNPEWEWHFMGYNPYDVIKKIGDRATYQAHIANFPNYFSYLHNANHSLQLVVSIENSFNFSKSNVAWLEASFAGAMTIAPNWPEWQVPGVYKYDDKDFQSVLQIAMDNFSTNFILAGNGWDFIQSNLTLKKVNKERIKILEKIVR